jgi:hypothetical protein
MIDYSTEVVDESYPTTVTQEEKSSVEHKG